MDPDGSTIVFHLFALLFFVALSAFFSASEAAIVALSDGKIRRMAEEGDARAKRIVALTGTPARFLATTQAGVTISGLMAVAVAAQQLAALLAARLGLQGSQPGLLILVTLVLGAVILIFGNLLPRRLAAYFPEAIAFGTAPALQVTAAILRPLVALLSGCTNLLLRLLGQNPNAELEKVTEEEIRMLVDVGEESGAIEQSEKDMINNIFEFDDRTVDEIMTHRMEVAAVSEEASLQEVVAVARESGYSRIPVYAEDMDSILGILYAKDLLGLIENPQEFDIHNFLREPYYVPVSTRCTELFKYFQAKKIHMAVVVDEYGGTYGIVTMEDLLETIVGNIQDEYDNEPSEFEQVSDTTYIIDGWASVDEVERTLGIVVPEEVHYETLGGVLIDLLGDIPQENDHPSVTIGNVLFTVLAMEDRRIKRIQAQVVSAADLE